MKKYVVKYYFWKSDAECSEPVKTRKNRTFPDLISAMMWIRENAENDGDNFIGVRIDQRDAVTPADLLGIEL